jgi:crossover junction endodeoxyribonuclease RusA
MTADPHVNPFETPILPSVMFTVPGLPAPQGNHRAFISKKTGRAFVTEKSGPVGPWRNQVALAAQLAWEGRPILTEVPVYCVIEFVLKRATSTPKSRPTPPAIKAHGDLDKLERAVYDAITGVIIADDKLIVTNSSMKRIAELGEPTGASITVRQIPWPPHHIRQVIEL